MDVEIVLMLLRVRNNVAHCVIHANIHGIGCPIALSSKWNERRRFPHDEVGHMLVAQKRYHECLLRIQGIVAVVRIDVKIAVIPHIGEHRTVVNANNLAQSWRNLEYI